MFLRGDQGVGMEMNITEFIGAKYRHRLLKYSYPDIMVQDSEEKVEKILLGKSNRKFLCNWIVHILNPSYDVLNGDHEDLLKALQSLNICKPEECKLFFNEGKGLLQSDNLRIISKIFDLLEKNYAERQVLEIFDSLKANLMRFNYPRIKHMKDDEIAAIFSKPNRRMLLLWLIPKMDKAFDIRQNNAAYAKWVFEWSMTTSLVEATNFVKGEIEKGKEMEDVRMLRKLFDLMVNLNTELEDKTLEFEESTIIESIGHKDGEEIRNLSVNLFPQDGEPKSYSTQGRFMMNLEIEKELEELDISNLSACSDEEDIVIQIPQCDSGYFTNGLKLNAEMQTKLVQLNEESQEIAIEESEQLSKVAENDNTSRIIQFKAGHSSVIIPNSAFEMFTTINAALQYKEINKFEVRQNLENLRNECKDLYSRISRLIGGSRERRNSGFDDSNRSAFK